MFLAHYQGKCVAGAVFFHFKDRALFKYGASDERFNRLGINNLVIWEKNSKAPVDRYNIYRESQAAGIYDLLGTVDHEDLSIMVDPTADPTVQAYLYKITGVDTSG